MARSAIIGQAQFLLPLLHGAPSTQLLQFRSALLLAHETQRTLVLPQLSVADAAGSSTSGQPLAGLLDTAQLEQLVPVVDLTVFRALANGTLSACLCGANRTASAAFAPFLATARLRCVRWLRTTDTSTATVGGPRFLGVHLPGVHGKGTRAFAYLLPSRSVADVSARVLESLGLGGGGFTAAHVPDKGDDEADCNVFLRGVPGRQFTACGNHSSRIGARTQAALIWHLVRSRASLFGKLAAGAAAASRPRVYVASSSDPNAAPRVKRVVRALTELGASVVTARAQISEMSDGAPLAVAAAEQLICARAELFIGSRYSSYADTVNGMRQAEWARRVSSGEAARPAPGKRPRYQLYTFEGTLPLYEKTLPKKPGKSGLLTTHQEGSQVVV